MLQGISCKQACSFHQPLVHSFTSWFSSTGDQALLETKFRAQLLFVGLRKDAYRSAAVVFFTRSEEGKVAKVLVALEARPLSSASSGDVRAA